MSAPKYSVGGGEVAKSVQSRSTLDLLSRKLGDLSPQTWNNRDSGFIEQTGMGGPENIVPSDKNVVSGTKYSEELTEDGYLSSAESGSSEIDIPVDELTSVTTHQRLWSVCPDKAQGFGSSSSDTRRSGSMASSFSEFTETEKINAKGEEEFITAERLENVSCPPKPLPRFMIIRPPKLSTIMLKWPLSNGRFLRAAEDTDRPVIIIDIYRKEFKHQYCFTTETKDAVDENEKCHYLMCFRYDLHGRSFYLVPQYLSAADTCPKTIKFVFAETERQTVMDTLSDTNSKFWYTYKILSFPVLASLSHPRYYLSLEKGSKVLLRNTEGRQPDTRNFHVQVLNVTESGDSICNSSERYSLFDMLRIRISSLLCTK